MSANNTPPSTIQNCTASNDGLITRAPLSRTRLRPMVSDNERTADCGFARWRRLERSGHRNSAAYCCWISFSFFTARRIDVGKPHIRFIRFLEFAVPPPPVHPFFGSHQNGSENASRVGYFRFSTPQLRPRLLNAMADATSDCNSELLLEDSVLQVWIDIVIYLFFFPLVQPFPPILRKACGHGTQSVCQCSMYL